MKYYILHGFKGVFQSKITVLCGYSKVSQDGETIHFVHIGAALHINAYLDELLLTITVSNRLFT